MVISREKRNNSMRLSTSESRARCRDGKGRLCATNDAHLTCRDALQLRTSRVVAWRIVGGGHRATGRWVETILKKGEVVATNQMTDDARGHMTSHHGLIRRYMTATLTVVSCGKGGVVSYMHLSFGTSHTTCWASDVAPKGLSTVQSTCQCYIACPACHMSCVKGCYCPVSFANMYTLALLA